jgi:transcriptional regulator with XRE-family HTH domain
MLSQVLKKLGARIRELRVKRGWSQEEFAANCNLHRSHMGEIERGNANITLSTLLVITFKLQITVSALFQDIG